MSAKCQSAITHCKRKDRIAAVSTKSNQCFDQAAAKAATFRFLNCNCYYANKSVSQETYPCRSKPQSKSYYCRRPNPVKKRLGRRGGARGCRNRWGRGSHRGWRPHGHPSIARAPQKIDYQKNMTPQRYFCCKGPAATRACP